ncbi:hypothetical protein D9619_013041 [Psilocybe cf. subviscida]|uniref:HNH domain-containing protein n=1 Tax=Psilocybe cf. subviscida TaxID=2480587 RepID=A0A8H5AZN4_9AGAR|nr:hypothetical protein D9619_013041 [Psilocybe cf. subviscida]
MLEDSPHTVNFSSFKDCIARRLLHKVGPNESASADDGDALDEFATYLATESWPTIPTAAQSATYESKESVPDIDDVTFEAISPSFTESLISYGILSDEDDAMKFLRAATDEYLTHACAPPPPWKSTRTTECEICYREVSLTYHHLIPRSVHAKALKKGWHLEYMLNSVAWLCRPCHSAVHGVEPNDVLAQHYYTVELLLAREDIQKWQKYAAKQRPRGVQKFAPNKARGVAPS